MLAAALIAIGAAPVAADDAEPIAALERRLAANPDNVDVRLALASRLSWSGRWAEARRHALRVIDRNPTYWDAHLLVARIDAWRRDYPAARDRVRRVLRADPERPDALALAADIAIWSGAADEAIRYADRLLAVDDGAAARYRRAQAAALDSRDDEARRWAQRTLAVDPEHEAAAAMLSHDWSVGVTSTTELEVFPIERDSVAYGQTVLGTFIPRPRWSVTAGYEYRYRFDTHNHRAQLGINHRLSSRLAVSGFLLGGSTEVVADLVGSAAVVYRWRHYAFTGRYRLDDMPWPGQLHRIFAGVGAGLPGGVELSAQYFGGVLRHCGATDPAQGVELRGRVSRDRGWASLLYGFGMELDRAPLPGFLEEQLGEDLCRLAGSEGLELSDTRAMLGGAEIGWQLPGRLELRGGYTASYRLSIGVAHLGFIGFRLWL